eukprot:11385529-Alexandrium_andersonii.AAC.1
MLAGPDRGLGHHEALAAVEVVQHREVGALAPRGRGGSRGLPPESRARLLALRVAVPVPDLVAVEALGPGLQVADALGVLALGLLALHA